MLRLNQGTAGLEFCQFIYEIGAMYVLVFLLWQRVSKHYTLSPSANQITCILYRQGAHQKLPSNHLVYAKSNKSQKDKAREVFFTLHIQVADKDYHSYSICCQCHGVPAIHKSLQTVLLLEFQCERDGSGLQQRQTEDPRASSGIV